MEEEKKTKETYEVIEIATQTQPVIHNTQTDKNMDLYEGVVKILNQQEKIMKSLG